MKNLESFLISKSKQIIKNENPEGKCDDWNSQLADALSEIGLQTTIVADSHIKLLGKNGSEIGHHAIAVAYSKDDNQWLAIDLSSPQIKDIDSIFFARRKSLVELAQAVKLTYGGAWKALDDEKGLFADIDRRSKIMLSIRKLKVMR